jgi:hypothetical protein
MSKNKVSFSFLAILSLIMLGVTIFLCSVWFKLNPSYLQVAVIPDSTIIKQKDSIILKQSKSIDSLVISVEALKLKRDTVRVPIFVKDTSKFDTSKIR